MSEEHRDRTKYDILPGHDTIQEHDAGSRSVSHADFDSPMKGDQNPKANYLSTGREKRFTHEDFESPIKGHEKDFDDMASISSFGTPEKSYYSEKMPLVGAKSIPPGRIVFNNFLGRAPNWYKICVILFLVCNPLSMAAFGKFFTGWLITAEFIFTLVMSLHCYALQPGGLIILEAVMMGMVSSHMIYHQVVENIPVLFLVIFMVAGIHFMRDFLMYFFTKLIVMIPNKTALSLVFMATTALFSAWLDALTVTAVIMNACYGFYSIYHHVAAQETRLQRNSPQQSPPPHSEHGQDEHAIQVLDDSQLSQSHRDTLDEFRLFLRSLLMHAVVGTAIGGALTEVGEPQNLLIAEKVGWTFSEYFWRSCSVSVPSCLAAFVVCFTLERFDRFGRIFGHGYKMPEPVRQVLSAYSTAKSNDENKSLKVMLIVQVLVAMMLVVFLGAHVAAVGLIGLTVIVLLTSFNGIVDEAQLGHAFIEAMPFTALLVVFFAVAGIIEENELFRGLVDWVLGLSGHGRVMGLFVIDGVLSSVSDNVFVAALYINEMARCFAEGLISKAELNILAVTINISTNIPSIATPNGQAAFLFLYTSKLAPLCNLSYFKMMLMALPYTIILTLVSFIMILFLGQSTQMLVDAGLLDGL